MDSTRCPYCGEWIDVFVDEGGAAQQDYIEDCSVCCRPIQFRVAIDYETGAHVIEATADP